MRVLIGALLAVATVGCGGSDTDPPQSVTEFETTEIAVGYSWIGLGSSHGYEFSGSCTDESCDLAVVCEDSVSDSPGGGTSGEPLPDVTVDAALVRDFVATFDSLDPIAEPTEVIEHTDDYPDLSITLTDDDGDMATFSTSSNTGDMAPWNVEFERMLYVSTESASAEAYSELLSAVGATSCWDD